MKIIINEATATSLKGGLLEIEGDSFQVITSKDSLVFDELGNGKLRVGPVEGTGVSATSHGTHSLSLGAEA